MEKPDFLTTLSDAERNALSICGITKGEQLRLCSRLDIARDFREAEKYFPEEMAAISSERLQEILRLEYEYRGAVEVPPDQTEEKPPPRPQAALPQSTATKSAHAASKKATAPDGKQRCIHCTNAFSIYAGAWSVVLLYIDIAAWVIVPVLLMLEIIEFSHFPGIVIPAILALPIFTYAVLSRFSICAVCKANVFSMRAISRNKHAHNYFLLGRKLSTALHVIFCLWFRCPVCGTPQNLLKRTRNKH